MVVAGRLNSTELDTHGMPPVVAITFATLEQQAAYAWEHASQSTTQMNEQMGLFEGER